MKNGFRIKANVVKAEKNDKGFVTVDVAVNSSRKVGETWETETTFLRLNPFNDRVKDFALTLAKGEKIDVRGKVQKGNDYKLYLNPEEITVIARGSKEKPTETTFNVNECAVTGTIFVKDGDKNFEEVSYGTEGKSFLRLVVSRYDGKDKEGKSKNTYLDFAIFNEKQINYIKSNLKHGDNVTVRCNIKKRKDKDNKELVFLNFMGLDANRSFENGKKIEAVEAAHSVVTTAAAEVESTKNTQAANDTAPTNELFAGLDLSEDFVSYDDDGDLPF